MCEHNKRNTGDSYCAYCRVNEQDMLLDKISYLANLWASQGGFIKAYDAGIEILKIMDTN
jgi:hypothetical protein